MPIETVAVTGGNGRIGGAIIEELNQRGYRTVNLNRGKRKSRVVDDQDGADRYLQTQLLDPGEVFASIAESEADAVIHMASIPNPLSNVGYETYESNVMSAYHVLDAASKLALEAVVLPSSVNVMGGAFQTEPMEIDYLPVDEDHRVTPRDPYATAKHALEVTADGFGRRSGSRVRIASLRFPWVATTGELTDQFKNRNRTLAAVTGQETAFARDDLFAYLHVEDAARIACAVVEAEYHGHERFWAVARDTTSSAVTSELIEECYADCRIERSFEDRAALVSTDKATRMLGWEPRITWERL